MTAGEAPGRLSATTCFRPPRSLTIQIRSNDPSRTRRSATCGAAVSMSGSVARILLIANSALDSPARRDASTARSVPSAESRPTITARTRNSTRSSHSLGSLTISVSWGFVNRRS